jgi:NAD(P)-dependent dehydrogenase (short-subunit alcohol dehydrogenase family)
MSDKPFAGRTALVTGGARGIGRAIALMLAEAGARVAVNYERNAAAAGQTVDRCRAAGADAEAFQADVSQPEAVTEMVDSIRGALGPVDLLVNNAGIFNQRPHAELTFAEWKRMLQVNLDGTFLVTWAVKDEMLARRFGRIVNISSLAGVVKKPAMIHYATAKAAVIAFTRSCSEAFAPHVRVNCLAPGLTQTEIIADTDPALLDQIVAATPLGRMGQPEEMARVARFLLSEDSSFVTGQTIVACGGRT